MENHFGKGLMAGLKAREADSVTKVTRFCSDYKRASYWDSPIVFLSKPAIASVLPGKRAF